jgi:hypothetical protein
MRLIAYTEDGPIGTIAYEGGQLIGSSPVLQQVADAKVNVAGSPEAAFEMLRGYSNGYISYDPEEDAAEEFSSGDD